jgi:hypothetical protein
MNGKMAGYAALARSVLDEITTQMPGLLQSNQCEAEESQASMEGTN